MTLRRIMLAAGLLAFFALMYAGSEMPYIPPPGYGVQSGVPNAIHYSSLDAGRDAALTGVCLPDGAIDAEFEAPFAGYVFLHAEQGECGTMSAALPLGGVHRVALITRGCVATFELFGAEYWQLTLIPQ